MFKRLGHVLLIIAFLVATGSHWMLLQSVAWTNMLAENLQSYSFKEAVTRTFDGNHPCHLCCQIAEGKKTEKKNEVTVQVKKLEFVPLSAPMVLAAPKLLEQEAQPAFAFHSLIHRPLSPPPRGLFA